MKESNSYKSIQWLCLTSFILCAMMLKLDVPNILRTQSPILSHPPEKHPLEKVKSCSQRRDKDAVRRPKSGYAGKSSLWRYLELREAGRHGGGSMEGAWDWHYPGRRNEWHGLHGNCMVVDVPLAMVVNERNQLDITDTWCCLNTNDSSLCY